MVRLAKLLTVILPAMLVVGCDRGPSESERLANRAARVAKAKAEVEKPVAPRAQQVGGNELLTIDVPSADHLGYVETQRCYVWRDKELRTASLSCPHTPDPALPK